MEILEIAVFTFEELDEQAKEKAREWYRGIGFEYSWREESLESIKAFCSHFGVNLNGWNCTPFESVCFNHNAENSNFRGLKLKDINRDNSPTGYALDCTLWGEFHSEWKRTGSAKLAFDHALWQAFLDWRNDLEYQLSDEAVDDNIIANQYTFDECGKRF